jgi:hypothetical protein
MFVHFYVCVFLCICFSMFVYFYVCVFLCLCISMFVYISMLVYFAVRFESVFTKSLNDLLIEFLSKLSLSQVKPTKSFLSFEFEEKKNLLFEVLLNQT